MTVDAILALLALWCVFGLVTLYVIYRFQYYAAKQMENKYYLFAVRDDLIKLVATGKLREDEFLFREFYPIVNDLINKINSYRLRHILPVLQDKERIVSTAKFIEEFHRNIKDKPFEVVKVYNDFFMSYFKIIYRNSLLFRFLIQLSLPLGVVIVFVRRFKLAYQFFCELFQTQVQAFELVAFSKSMIIKR